jgi:CRP-like cAMP-binding protein
VEDRSTRRHRTTTRFTTRFCCPFPDNEYNLLQRHLEHIEFPQHHILQEAGAKIEFAYFLNGGMASLVVLTSDARSVEVAMVGKDGIVGTPLSVGFGARSPTRRHANPGHRAQGEIRCAHGRAEFHARTAGEMESLV